LEHDGHIDGDRQVFGCDIRLCAGKSHG
jgi:hypothetical protein